MRHLSLLILVLVVGAVGTNSFAAEKTVEELKAEGFVPLFDGKTFSGWKANENPKSWNLLPDGTIRGKGDCSHLFSPKQYSDFIFRAEFKTEPGSNSGQYFRTAIGPGFPKGYEAQVNNTHGDPQKTGSLYGFAPVHEQLVQDGQWWTQEVECVGNHIVIRVNGKKVIDYVDENNTYTKGHFAFQQHDPMSVIYIRNVMVKDLSN